MHGRRTCYGLLRITIRHGIVSVPLSPLFQIVRNDPSQVYGSPRSHHSKPIPATDGLCIQSCGSFVGHHQTFYGSKFEEKHQPGVMWTRWTLLTDRQ
jgi:hypothetical protein